MNILGISAFYHTSAACLLQTGRLTAAVAEERFSRRKHDPAFPVRAARWCLSQAGLTIADVDAVAYYENPPAKLARQLWAGRPVDPAGDCGWLDPRRPERAVREGLGFEGPFHAFPHHLSHAASAFFFSGFEAAATLTVDGVGEWATTTYGQGQGAELTLFEEVHFPDSLGLLYATLTAYLGFRVNDGEYKVMGLAAYGQPRFLPQLRQLIEILPAGQYRLNPRFFDYVRGERMYSAALADLLGGPPRAPEAEVTAFHADVARSVQQLLEEVLLDKAAYLRQRTGLSHLCLAGGVALNCVANQRLRASRLFEDIFIQPAAGDDGACLGAAALAHCRLTGQRPGPARLTHAGLGPAAEPQAIAALLGGAGLAASDFRGDEAGLLDAVVDGLVAGHVIGWFHGRMEFGPRALGARSLLADPRRPEMRDRINALIKRREGFRPFAPSILAEQAAAHLDLDHPSPFMLETCAVRSPVDLPAITHVDGSCRPHTVDRTVAPRLAALLDRFQARTGCPLLLNTSFNLRDEPIVCGPAEALACFVEAGFETLVLEDFLIDRAALPHRLPALLAAWQPDGSPAPSRPADFLYTFV